MSTRQVLGAVGAAVGGYFFGPQGAQWGWAIGSAVGGAIDPEIIKGPSVGDIAAQTSQEGVPRPIVFALSQPIAGNIIASSEPKIVKKRQRQGKGGPKVETESVFRTYAIGVCEGPITRFVRVWRNGELKYDAENEVMSTPFITTLFGQTINLGTQNGAFLKHARFFLGTWEQDASPDLEAIFGVGTTPAHRGTAYMVMADEDLTDLRGAIPQYQFQVERCEGFYLTSRPYALEAADALRLSADIGPKLEPLIVEGLDFAADIVSGELEQVLLSYTDGAPEALDFSADIASGELRVALHTYDDGAPEALDFSADIASGELRVALITYDDGAPEALDFSADIVSGSLT